MARRGRQGPRSPGPRPLPLGLRHPQLRGQRPPRSRGAQAARRGWHRSSPGPSPCPLPRAGGCTRAAPPCRNSTRTLESQGGPRPLPAPGRPPPLTGRERRTAERSMRSMLSQGRKRRTLRSRARNAFRPSKSCGDRWAGSATAWEWQRPRQRREGEQGRSWGQPNPNPLSSEDKKRHADPERGDRDRQSL